MILKEGESVWVKTRVCYFDHYTDDEYQCLGLDSVTLWDMNEKENRDNTRRGDYVEDLESENKELKDKIKNLLYSYETFYGQLPAGRINEKS